MLEASVTKATEKFGINITVILAIIEAIMALFENCPERRNLAQQLKSPGVMGRVRLRRELRKIFEAEDCCQNHRRQISEIACALECQCEAMSVEDCQACVNEVLGMEDA